MKNNKGCGAHIAYAGLAIIALLLLTALGLWSGADFETQNIKYVPKIIRITKAG